MERIHTPFTNHQERKCSKIKSLSEQYINSGILTVAGYHYILLAIDIFSCYAWKVPLRGKSKNEVVCILSKIFKERVPAIVRSDKGTEFLGHKVQSLFKSHLIRHLADSK